MTEAAIVLEQIHKELSALETGLVGALRLTPDNLSLAGGEVTLTALIHEPDDDAASRAHCHVTSGFPGALGTLDACVLGYGDTREAALRDAASTWCQSMACVVLSLVHSRPVLDATHFDGADATGVPGCHGFAGPLAGRLFGGATEIPQEVDGLPFFEYAAAMAPPGVLHLVKVTLHGHEEGCSRYTEVDGHRTKHSEEAWGHAPQGLPSCILTCFAAFYFQDSDPAQPEREPVESAIRGVIREFEANQDLHGAGDKLEVEGFDPDLIHEVLTFLPCAAAHAVFEPLGVTLASTFCRVEEDGAYKADLPLMAHRPFARSWFIIQDILDGADPDTANAIAMYSSEAAALEQALSDGSQPEDLVLMPPVVGFRTTPQEHIHSTVQELIRGAQFTGQARQPDSSNEPTNGRRKPWWRFW